MSREILEELSEELKNEDEKNFHLYLVIRKLKKGIAKSKKVLDKYDFHLKKVDINKELKVFFKSNLLKQLEKTIHKKDLEITDYSVIDDDLSHKLYTYSLNNALSFSKVIKNEFIRKDIENISSLKEIKEDLWAYSLKVEIGDEEDNKYFYSFRKISKGKIGTDENNKTIKEKITALFDINDSKLEVLKKETINFDDKVDCVYINGQFYIFSKSQFETIVGLEEEFKQNADNVISILESNNLIEGIEIIKENLSISKSLLKTLANIAKKGNHNNFNSNEIIKMKEAFKKFEGKELKMKDNKILIEDTKDMTNFVKLLNDYYKQGIITGKYYGTNSGRLLEK